MKFLPAFSLILFAFLAQAERPDQTATTDDARRVILKSDGTWKYADGAVSKKEPLSLDGYSEKQASAFKATVLALRKLNDAAAFGISYMQYKTKMGETKTAIDDADLLLPDGATKKSVKDAWSFHLMASLMWDIMQRAQSLPLTAKERAETLKLLPRLKIANPNYVTRQEYLDACWAEAQDKLKPLIELAAL